MEGVFSTDVVNQVRVARLFPCEGRRVLLVLLPVWPIDTRVLARSGESTVR